MRRSALMRSGDLRRHHRAKWLRCSGQLMPTPTCPAKFSALGPCTSRGSRERGTVLAPCLEPSKACCRAAAGLAAVYAHALERQHVQSLTMHAAAQCCCCAGSAGGAGLEHVGVVPVPRPCEARQADRVVQAAQHGVPPGRDVRRGAPAVAHLRTQRGQGFKGWGLQDSAVSCPAACPEADSCWHVGCPGFRSRRLEGTAHTAACYGAALGASEAVHAMCWLIAC